MKYNLYVAPGDPHVIYVVCHPGNTLAWYLASYMVLPPESPSWRHLRLQERVSILAERYIRLKIL